MYDYGDLVYLDVQKTGSTFVMGFLRASCTLPMRPSKHHARIVGDYRSDAYYFATVRHPLPQYTSLFRYGADGNGAIAGRIRRAGRGDLYELGFEHWLEFVLDDRNALILGEGFAEVAGSGLGFMSFRFVALSIANAMRILPSARSIEDVRHIYAERNLARRVIRNEELNEGLRALAVEDVPQWFDPEAADAFLAGGRRNASYSPVPTLPNANLLQELQRREALLLDAFYPDTQPADAAT
jgi:hypothetical protein